MTEFKVHMDGLHTNVNLHIKLKSSSVKHREENQILFEAVINVAVNRAQPDSK